MKKVLVGAMALLTLAACSNEEVLQKNEVNQEIGFTAVTGKALSRANDGYCNKSLPATFYVTASYTTDGSTYNQYFLNDGFKQGSGNTYVSSGSVRYWPELGTAIDDLKMKFFATTSTTPGTPNPVVIDAPKWSVNGTEMMLENYTVGTDVSKQHDLLYAVTTVEEKPTPGVQEINFRHALSQIEFQAKNSNSTIHVEICGVSVVNVNNKGTFKFSADTDENYNIHTTPSGSEPASVGTWSAWDDKETYAVTFNPTVIGTGATSLTVANDGEKEYSTNTMYLIPQAIIPWNKTDHAKPTEDPAKGTYFLVKAKIWNIAATDGVFNSTTDVQLWGSGSSMNASGAKDIAVPANSITWAPGKRYVYTFEFTASGNGGTDPGTGHEVLTPIKLSVTVDDFVDAGEISVPLTK